MQGGPPDILEAQRASLSAHCEIAVASAVAFIPGGVPTSIVTTNEDSLPGRPLYERFARAQAQETQATELVICFHGTASRNIGPISREGLDASKRGSAYGQKLGAGEYFAENLPVALQYAMRHRQLGGVNDQVLVFTVFVRLGFPHLGIPSEISDKQGSWGRIFVIADPARTLPLAVLTVPQHAEEIVLQWSRASRVARVTSSFTPYLRQGETPRTPRQQGEREQLEHKRKVEKMFKHLGERQLGQSAPLAVPQLGSCAFSERAWRLWAALMLTPRKRPAHWAPSHRLGCSSEPPPKPPMSPPLTIQKRDLDEASAIWQALPEVREGGRPACAAQVGMQLDLGLSLALCSGRRRGSTACAKEGRDLAREGTACAKQDERAAGGERARGGPER